MDKCYSHGVIFIDFRICLYIGEAKNDELAAFLMNTVESCRKRGIIQNHMYYTGEDNDCKLKKLFTLLIDRERMRSHVNKLSFILKCISTTNGSTLIPL